MRLRISISGHTIIQGIFHSLFFSSAESNSTISGFLFPPEITETLSAGMSLKVSAFLTLSFNLFSVFFVHCSGFSLNVLLCLTISFVVVVYSHYSGDLK